MAGEESPPRVDTTMESAPDANAADLFAPVQSFLRGSAKLGVVEAALDAGADPNSWKGPLTPLRCAVQANNSRLMKLLLARGASSDLKDAKGVAPLHVACFDGKSECVRALLDAGADANIRDRHEQTPFFFAATRQVCELLLAANADVNVKNAKQQSPLHLAAHAGLKDIIAFFTEHGGEDALKVEDKNGNTPVSYAAKSKMKSAVGILKKKGPDAGKQVTQKASLADVTAVMQQRLIELQVENESLKVKVQTSEVASAKETLSEEEKSRMEEEIQKLRNDLAEEKARFEARQEVPIEPPNDDEKAKVREELEQLRKELADEKSRSEELSNAASQVEQLRKELADKQFRSDELIKSAAQVLVEPPVDDEKAKLAEEVEQLRKELANEQSRSEEMSKVAAQVPSQPPIDDTKTKHAEEVEQLQKRLADERSRSEEITKVIRASEQAAKQLAEEKTAKELEARRLAEESAAALAAAEADASAKEAEIEDLQRRLEQQARQSAEEAVKANQLEAQKLAEEKAAALTALAAAEAKALAKEAEVGELQKQMQRVEEERSKQIANEADSGSKVVSFVAAIDDPGTPVATHAILDPKADALEKDQKPQASHEPESNYEAAGNTSCDNEEVDADGHGPEESAIDLSFDLDYKIIDHDAFRETLQSQLQSLGIDKMTIFVLKIELREGSVIARISGPVPIIEERLKKLPLHEIVVMGCHAKIKEYAPAPKKPPLRQEQLMEADAPETASGFSGSSPYKEFGGMSSSSLSSPGPSPAGSKAGSAAGGREKRDVIQEERDGCLLWQLTLKKQNIEDKFGFLQANGRGEFQNRANARGEASSIQGGPEVLIVRRIHEGGLLDRWNQRHPEADVRAQDRICMVNGETTIEGMQREIRSRKIAMKIVRYPSRFVVLLRKDGRRLGFRFERPRERKETSKPSEEVRITEVMTEGAMQDYNSEQAALGRWAFVVLPDMRIEAVNDSGGDALQIADCLKTCNEVKLQIRRAEQPLSNSPHFQAQMQMIAALRQPIAENSPPPS